MKVSCGALFALFGLGASHAIFQKVSVNGVDQGQLKGVRYTTSNYPIENVADSGFACNKGLTKDNNVISVPAGARVGAWWGHVIGGPQGANDPDNPIAASHKGPIIVYLAKVSDAASAGTSGLQWFKVAEAGLSNGVWAVDTMISNQGWHYFTMPTCVAPGDYLMRVELIALHNAYSQGGAQFYMECAQIRITGSGTNSGSNFVSFPGAYSATHPGIQLNIYDGSKPNNGGRPYSIPGPSVLSCSSGNNGGNNGGSGGGGSGSGAPLYGQCGGTGWTGPTTCAQGTCKAAGQFYSQCTP